MVINLVDNSTMEKYRNVEIVTEENLPNSEKINNFIDNKSLREYTIYKDYCSNLLYAVDEDAKNE